MADNSTEIEADNVLDLYLVTGGSFLSIIISSVVCLIVLISTYVTPNLHTPTNLLICNTCLSSVCYAMISTVNSLIFYIQLVSSDWSCRIRGYLTYVCLNLVIYSYTIQAISRLFWTVLYRRRYLLTFKCHIYMITIQISLAFLLPFTGLVTNDIVYRPFKICGVSMKNRIHAFYLLSVIYIIPLLSVLILYKIIYRHVIRATVNLQQSAQRAKRDRELARNILILYSIFLFGGFPTIIYIIVSNQMNPAPGIFLLLAEIAPSISVDVERIVTVILNKDIRKVLKQRCLARFSTPVEPIAENLSVNTRTLSKAPQQLGTTFVK